MGRRDRERIERIMAGKEKPFRHLNNPVARKAVALASRSDVIKTLEQASTEDQLDALNRTVAGQRPDKLKQALMKKTPKEMDKAIYDFLKNGKAVNVATLTEEIRNTPDFLALCSRVGLELSWFEQLARDRMKIHGIVEG